MSEDADSDLGQFVAAHERSLLRFAYMVTGNKHEAEDAVQDALLKVARRWHRVRPEGALAYVRTTIVNERRSRWRQAGRRVHTGPQEEAEQPSTHDGVLRYESDRAFFDLLRNLPRKQRAALILRYYYGLPDSEIAISLNSTPQTVRSQIHRALEKLRNASSHWNDGGL